MWLLVKPSNSDRAHQSVPRVLSNLRTRTTNASCLRPSCERNGRPKTNTRIIELRVSLQFHSWSEGVPHPLSHFLRRTGSHFGEKMASSAERSAFDQNFKPRAAKQQRRASRVPRPSAAIAPDRGSDHRPHEKEMRPAPHGSTQDWRRYSLTGVWALNASATPEWGSDKARLAASMLTPRIAKTSCSSTDIPRLPRRDGVDQDGKGRQS